MIGIPYRVNLLNDPPFVDNPIADITVDEDGPDTLVELVPNTFNDPDILTNNQTLTLQVVGNTNPQLVTAGIVVGVEVGFVLLGLLLVPWGARDERLVSSMANGLRRTWLQTSHALPAILLCGLFTAEVSYYIHQDFQGRGLGSALLDYTVKQCPKLEIKHLFAILLEVNIPSIGLLEKFQFERWGLMPDVVDLDGTECGHLIYGRRIY